MRPSGSTSACCTGTSADCTGSWRTASCRSCSRSESCSRRSVLFKIVPTGFIPSQDTGQIVATTEAAQGTSFEDMVRHQQQIAAVVARDTNITGFMSSVGSGGGSSNQGRIIMGLKPHGKRLDAQAIVDELRPKLTGVPGMNVFMQVRPAIQIGGRNAKSLYQFTMQSPDIATLYPAAQAMEAKMRGIAQIQDVTSDLQIANPQVSVQIDRDRAASLGVTANQIETALYNAYGSRQVSTIYTPNNEYWVVMELKPEFQQDMSALSMLYIRSRRRRTSCHSARSPSSDRASARSRSITPASFRRSRSRSTRVPTFRSDRR